MHGGGVSRIAISKDISPFGTMFATVVPLCIGSVSMGQLTTHVLDISAGLPAAGLRIEAHSWLAETPTLIASVATGSDGRLAKPLVAGAELVAGRCSAAGF